MNVKLRISKIFILRFFILLILVWISFGFFPILNIEGDSSLFSAGCERLLKNGLNIPPDYFYDWNMQPLTGIIVIGTKHIFHFSSCEQIYSTLTYIFAIAYLFISSIFISKLSGIRWEYCFFINILFPESYCIAFYPNTLIFASLVSLTGFLLILKKPVNIVSILLLGLAPLFRVDVLAIYPVVFFLFWKHYNLKRTVLFTSLYAASTVFFLFIGYLVLNADPLVTLRGLESIDKIFDLGSFMRINIAFYSFPVVLLIIIGFIEIYKSSDYKIIAIVLLPIITLYLLYIDFSGQGTKHIQYIIPFTGILCTYSFKKIKEQIVNKKYTLSYILITLFLIQSFIGIRIYPESKPWIAKTYSQQNPRPTLASLVSFKVPKLGMTKIVIGAGQVIPTADELMLSNGNFFAPFYWHDVKKMEKDERKILEHIISEDQDTMFFMTTQASDWTLSQHLHNLGFHIETKDQKPINRTFSSDFYFVNDQDKRVIYVSCIELERNPESFNEVFSKFQHRPLFVMVQWDWQMFFIKEGMTKAEPLSNQFSVVR